MKMEMDMAVKTFQSWSFYQLQIVFEPWNVTTKLQFAGSWFAIVFLTVAYNGLEFLIAKMEFQETSWHYKRHSLGDSSGANANVTGLGITNISMTGAGSKTHVQVTGISSLTYKLQHAALTSVSFGFSLILMLVAMTHNPWLFVALMIGWTLGDFILNSMRADLTRKTRVLSSTGDFILNPMRADLMHRTRALSSTGGVLVGNGMDCHGDHPATTAAAAVTKLALALAPSAGGGVAETGVVAEAKTGVWKSKVTDEVEEEREEPQRLEADADVGTCYDASVTGKIEPMQIDM